MFRFIIFNVWYGATTTSVFTKYILNNTTQCLLYYIHECVLVYKYKNIAQLDTNSPYLSRANEADNEGRKQKL